MATESSMPVKLLKSTAYTGVEVRVGADSHIDNFIYRHTSQ